MNRCVETGDTIGESDSARGYYRTKDTILDIYDAMQRVIATGEPYQTRLDSPHALRKDGNSTRSSYFCLLIG